MVTRQRPVFKTIINKLATLQLAISLLFIIGFTIALGTFIEQDQNFAFYETNYPTQTPILGFIDYNFIFNWQLNNLYSNFWFFFLIAIFGLSLLSCTFTTQLPALKKFRLWEFIKSTKITKTLKFSTSLQQISLDLFSYNVYKSKYHIFRQKTKNYAYSGLLGRVGPIIVHFSIILLLVGASIGSLTSFTVQEIVPRGEICHLQNFVKSGYLIAPKQNLSWRVNDFWVTYTNGTKTNQFYSDISVLNFRGEELKRKTIFVNEPFFYQGITVYQTDWDILGIKAKIDNQETIQLPLTKIKKSGQDFWFGSLSLDSNQTEKVTLLINNLNGRLNIYDAKGVFIKEIGLNDNLSLLENKNVQFTDFITTTGIQVKSDNGLTLVYFSFALLMLSIYLSFLSYSQVWFVKTGNNFILGGKANRAILMFQEQFSQLTKDTARFFEKY